MMQVLRQWYDRHFSNPQVVILALLLIIGFAVIALMGHILAPLLAGVVIAYLLDGSVAFLRRVKVPRPIAVTVVFSAFMATVILVLFVLIPLLLRQVTEFFRELPNMLAKGQQLLMQLPEKYPDYVSEAQVQEIVDGIRSELGAFGRYVVSLSFSSVVDLITILVYLILVPLLVFFFLKDKERIIVWAQAFLPDEHGLSKQVWREVNSKIAGYIRGKFAEILFVWVVTYVTFSVLGLNYAMLMSFLVGLSVIIPFVGAAVVTVPVAFIAYSQWGVGPEFASVLIAYLIIQFLDGNLLVPLLFSEVVNLHPVAIISAVVVFGGLWGFWGVFFAIPLATLVQAVINTWPAATRDKAPLQPPEVVAVAADRPSGRAVGPSQ